MVKFNHYRSSLNLTYAIKWAFLGFSINICLSSETSLLFSQRCSSDRSRHECHLGHKPYVLLLFIVEKLSYSWNIKIYIVCCHIISPIDINSVVRRIRELFKENIVKKLGFIRWFVSIGSISMHTFWDSMTYIFKLNMIPEFLVKIMVVIAIKIFSLFLVAKIFEFATSFTKFTVTLNMGLLLP